jgi:hypothetical protein
MIRRFQKNFEKNVPVIEDMGESLGANHQSGGVLPRNLAAQPL